MRRGLPWVSSRSSNPFWVTAGASIPTTTSGRPLVSRLLTVNGGAAALPGNYEVLLGTPVSDLIASAGGTRGSPARIVMGELATKERAKLRGEATKKLALARQERLQREAREKAEAAARRKAEQADLQAAAARIEQ